MTKSKAAFLANCDRLFEIGNVHFWTFTFPDVKDVKDASACWKRLVDWFTRAYRGQAMGVRVYELHKEHGLHVHALIVGRYDVNLVRTAAQRYGFGRIFVEKCRDSHSGEYLGKYLGKGRREDCLRGKRVWAVFGIWKGKTRVKDIEVHGMLSECFKMARAAGVTGFVELCVAAHSFAEEVLAGLRPCKYVEILI
ncbi:MAG: hypothetical protein PHV34_20360 [Verrucomicrobiae bacterium]|nr:hypothetical protein [Verrucomicrobiae bacterium]